MAAPTSAWPSKRIRSAIRKVAGLPASWNKTPSASAGTGCAHALEHQHHVGPDIALRMIFGRLRDALVRLDFGRHLRQKTGKIQQFKSTPRRAFDKNPDQLVPNSFRRYFHDASERRVE